MEHDHRLITRFMQSLEDQKEATETIRKIGDDILKSIGALEKDKKVSVFAMAAPK
jgi:hypothetical protein